MAGQLVAPARPQEREEAPLFRIDSVKEESASVRVRVVVLESMRLGDAAETLARRAAEAYGATSSVSTG